VGASFIATKVALRDLSPVTLVWMRFGIGVVILGIATAARRQFAFPARNELGYLALLGFFGHYPPPMAAIYRVADSAGHYNRLDYRQYSRIHGIARLGISQREVEPNAGCRYCAIRARRTAGC